MLAYGNNECFVMQMLYVCVLCAFCGSSQCALCIPCSLLMLVNDARGDHGRGIRLSRSHDCLVYSHECLFLFTQSCCGECFYYL